MLRVISLYNQSTEYFLSLNMKKCNILNMFTYAKIILFTIVVLSKVFLLSVGSEVDECHINPHICGQGVCYNTAESYTCHCYEGYQLDDSENTCVGKEQKVLQSCGLHVVEYGSS